MSLLVREDAERHAGHLLRRLDDTAAELLRAGERRLDVVDGDKEEHGVAPTLQRADRGRQRAVAVLDERVAGERAIGVRPAEELAEERARRVRICRANLR